MKQFFKFMFATIVGIFVSVLLFVLILSSILVGIASGDDKEEAVKEKSVLQLSLDYMIPERTSKNPFEEFDFVNFEANRNCGLNDLLKSIHHAAGDDKIKGIYLDMSFSPNSYATLLEVRDALIEFKKSKKFVIAYGEVMEEHSYYIASVADKVYLNPAGDLLINGYSHQSPYFKSMFEKIGVEPILIRHGKFKAAGEPFIADKMSPENREQIESYAGSIYNHFLASIAASRKKDVAQVTEIANKLLIQTPEDAKTQGMIDDIRYEDEVMADLRKRLDVGEKEKINFVNPLSYSRTAKDNSSITSKNKIAVIYLAGDISSGESDGETVGSETSAETISKVRKDSSVKAIVLRINSPGGSALASDVIWREVELARKAKPVIASFGAVAASGGYYIAAPATKIVAEPNTVTGSIGVFGLLLNAQKLLKDKLGINMQTVKSGEFSDMGSPDRAPSQAEMEIIQRGVDRIYDDFVSKVATGRKLDKAAVDSIAQGRVWAGSDALRIGLVDELGGFNKAITIAVKEAKLDDYKIVNYPDEKSPFDNLLKSMGEDASVWISKKQLGESYPYYEMLKKAGKYQGIQARMLVPLESTR